MVAFGPNRIEFQFPPRVKSDSRTGEWTAVAVDGGKTNNAQMEEPLFTYQGGNPRKIQMEWDYLVTDGEINAFNQGGLAWTVDRITRNLTTLRRYAANVDQNVKQNAVFDQLLIKLILYDIGGRESMSYRSDGVTISYDDGLFIGNDRTFPLKTTVAMTLYSWPIVGAQGKGSFVANGQVRTFADWY